MQGCKRGVLFLAIALVIGIVFASSARADPPATEPGLPVQLALGDSWVTSVGASDPSEGYVAQLNEALIPDFDCLPASEETRDICKYRQLVNLGVGGATTQTLIDTQLQPAEDLLESRNADANARNDVEVITLHIGGNDLFGSPILPICLPDFISTGNLTDLCVGTINAVFATYRSNLTMVLSRLRAAAGAETRIVIGTYDNPISDPNCKLPGLPPGFAPAAAFAAIVLEGENIQLEDGAHDIMRQVAEQFGGLVAEVFRDLDPTTDWKGDCLHPDDSGYDKITVAFLQALGVEPQL
jgi:GDSL-like Lipase/Acylhydrolase family